MNSILSDTGTVKAVRIHSFGGPESLCIEEVASPTPAPGEVLVRVHAAGVNPFDWKMCEGLLGTKALPQTLGYDFSGVIEALGPEVTDLFVGQAVFGYSARGGTFAELVAVPAETVAAKVPAVSDVEAAATPLGALTAWEALFEAGDLQRGQKVLIHGAAGGVGAFAVQFALRHGSWVIATASSRNLPFLCRLGANQLIDHNATRFEDTVKNVDVVLDLIGGETLDRSWKVLKPGGRLVSTVSTPSEEKARLCGVRARKMQTQARGDDLTFIGDLIANGEIKVTIEKIYPMAGAAEALEWSRRAHSRGKTVLTIDHEAGHGDGHSTH